MTKPEPMTPRRFNALFEIYGRVDRHWAYTLNDPDKFEESQRTLAEAKSLAHKLKSAYRRLHEAALIAKGAEDV